MTKKRTVLVVVAILAVAVLLLPIVLRGDGATDPSRLGFDIQVMPVTDGGGAYTYKITVLDVEENVTLTAPELTSMLGDELTVSSYYEDGRRVAVTLKLDARFVPGRDGAVSLP